MDPIDAVYTWVDGNDPEFQEQLQRHRNGAGREVAAARFHDNQELRYSLRSLDRYAPWIRKIYLVTNGQIPDWMERSHPRLTLVRHDELFKDRAALPVFNSRAIEWQLFRIPGLSRRFLYLHDDFFFGSLVTPDDFLTPKGGSRVFLEPFDIPPDGALAFTERLLNSRFGDRSPRKQVAHVPRLIDRTLLEEVHRLWEMQIKRTATHRFRHPEDVSLENLYFHFLLESPLQFGVHEQAVAVTRPKTYRFEPISSRCTTWGRLASIALTRPKFFCLNDETDGDSEAAARSVRKKARLFLKLYYWRRSSLERR